MDSSEICVGWTESSLAGEASWIGEKLLSDVSCESGEETMDGGEDMYAAEAERDTW